LVDVSTRDYRVSKKAEVRKIGVEIREI